MKLFTCLIGITIPQLCCLNVWEQVICTHFFCFLLSFLSTNLKSLLYGALTATLQQLLQDKVCTAGLKTCHLECHHIFSIIIWSGCTLWTERGIVKGTEGKKNLQMSHCSLRNHVWWWREHSILTMRWRVSQCQRYAECWQSVKKNSCKPPFSKCAVCISAHAQEASELEEHFGPKAASPSKAKRLKWTFTNKTKWHAGCMHQVTWH